MLKKCLREPIPEIYDAARYLDAATSAHLDGNFTLVEELIELTNNKVLREYTESLWGANSPYISKVSIVNSYPRLPIELRVKNRMPNAAERLLLHKRDGNHCRFCGIPLIRDKVRKYFQCAYPHLKIWGGKNPEQHAAFQLMWLQYDHLIPHSRGGDNSLNNVIITCAPCNYGRVDYLIEEQGLENPFERIPLQSNWDGLERIFKS